MIRFLTYIWNNYKKPAIILGILGILSSVTSVIMSYCLKYSVDCIFQVQNKNGTVAIMLFGLMAVTTYLSDQLGENYLVQKYSLCFVRDLRKSLVESHLHMDYKQARERAIGELMNQDNVAKELGNLFAAIVYHFPYCVLESVGFILFLGVAVSWKMDLILIILVPFALLFKKVIEGMRKTNWEINRARTDSHNFFLDILHKTDFIKANDITEAIENKYQQKNRAVFSLQKRIFRQNGIFAFMQFFLEHGIQFIVAVIGAALMLNGDLTPGGVAMATTVFSTFLVPSLSQLIGLIKEAGSSEEIVHSIMEKTAFREEKPLYHRVQMPSDVLIRLEQAGCTGRNGKIFEGVSLDLPSKGLLGISSKSGEGKSTLAKMIAGLLQPAGGHVLYNSLYFTEEDICGKIAYLDSEPYFMEGTILENLKASGAGCDKVLEMDEIRAFLDEIPDKENTLLTKDAATLSGGQRQLLGLARALVKQDARLIILDEPTASMDEGTGKRVWQILKRLSEEKCVLIISHQKELLAGIPIKYLLKNQHLQREKESITGGIYGQMEIPFI